MKGSSKVSGFIAIVAISALAVAPLLAGAGGGAGGGMTTADLALQLARAAGIGHPASDSPQAALESLGTIGIDLGSDLKAPVTEKTLIQVGQAVGVAISSSHPEAAVTPAVSGALIQLLKGALQSAAFVSGRGGADLIHASCQGRASRAARRGTPASPSSNFNASAGPCEEPVP